jgi:hypothetical protein
LTDDTTLCYLAHIFGWIVAIHQVDRNDGHVGSHRFGSLWRVLLLLLLRVSLRVLLLRHRREGMS